jgi:hypothetical protein
MHTHTTAHARWSRFRRAAQGASLAVAVAGAFSILSCKTTEFLQVQDPDIINPSDVSTPAGANAARVGALARLNTATSGGESLLLLGGLFADEWNNGDSFIARQEIDLRIITPQNTFLTDANRALHRARLSAEQAIGLLRAYSPTAPAWQVAEMYFAEAYLENLAAEHYCSGLVFSTVINGAEVFGGPLTTTDALTRALAHADSGLALAFGTTVDDIRVKSALQVTRGRILLNLNRPAEALLAVTGVLTSFQYLEYHAITANSNQFWSFNNSAGRYSVSTGEGVNGLNFATANDPRVPTCQGNDAVCKVILVTKSSRDDLTTPFYVQRMWPVRESSVPIVSGLEARMIEAEGQLRADPLLGPSAPSLATLNAARATFTGLANLVDAGTPAARVDQLFRERAFTLFGRGNRTGDLRRLMGQYGRAANTVFPTGPWHKGGNYGTDVNIILPLAETNNPTAGAGVCLDRTK